MNFLLQDKQLQKQKHEMEKLRLQREIEARTGITFSYKKGKRRKQKKNTHPSHMNRKERRNYRYGRLTKLPTTAAATNNKNTTSKDALKKKVLSARSIDKISQMNNQKSRSKHEEKFGSNFNY